MDEHAARTLVFQNQSLETVLRDLASRGVMSVFMEGGGQVLASAFSGGWVDEVIFYAAPLISGSGQSVVACPPFTGGSIPLQFVDIKQVAEDIRIHALVLKSPLP